MPSSGHQTNSSSSASATEASRLPLIEALQGTALALAVGMAIIAPRSAPVFVSILAVLVLAKELSAEGVGQVVDKVRRTGLPVFTLFVFLAWAGLSALWAVEPGFTLRSIGQTTVIVSAGIVIVSLLPGQLAGMPDWRQRHIVRPVAIGFLAGLLYIGVEFATRHALSFHLISRFPALMGDNAKEFAREGDRLVDLLPFFLDRNTAALTLLMPAAWLSLSRLLPQGVRAAGLWVIFGAGGVVVALSWSGASKLALIAGVGAALIWERRPEATATLFRIVAVAVILLSLPLVIGVSKLGLADLTSLPPSVRERIVIWTNTTVAVTRAPVIGIGAQSTRFQTETQARQIEGVRAERRRALGWHAHNSVLQTWLELGGVGALLLLAWLLSMPRAIHALGAGNEAAAAGLMAMVSAISLTGWGMWQPWLVGVYVTAVAALCACLVGQKDRCRAS